MYIPCTPASCPKIGDCVDIEQSWCLIPHQLIWFLLSPGKASSPAPPVPLTPAPEPWPPAPLALLLYFAWGWSRPKAAALLTEKRSLLSTKINILDSNFSGLFYTYNHCSPVHIAAPVHDTRCKISEIPMFAPCPL